MVKKTLLISIIINCHNGGAFLKDCLLSIKRQTYKNFEVIFWDNASNDNSKIIFLSAKDSRFNYFYKKKKKNLYKARNLALKKTKGDFITFIDTDDMWDKDKLKIQINEFKNKDIGVVYSNILLQKLNGSKKLLFKEKLPSGMICESFYKNYYPTILSAMVKKNILKIKFNEKYNHIGDFDFFFRLSKIVEFKAINKPLGIYRVHENNLSKLSRINEVKEMEDWIKKNINLIDKKKINKLKARLNYQRFLYFKLKSKFFKSFFYILLNNYNFVFFFKKILIFITPVMLLKKILWF